MGIQLGSLVLNNGLVWTDEFLFTSVVQELKTTLGGAPILYSAPVSGPIAITLASEEDQGWQTYAQVKELQSMARVLDGQYQLTLGSRVFTVGFRHYEPPVLEARPLVSRTEYADTDYFVVTLKLISFL